MSDPAQQTQTTPAGAVPLLTDGLGGDFRAMSEHAYCAYIDQLRRPTCLGWEQKVKSGQFGQDNLESFQRAAEWLGRHKAMHEAAKKADALQSEIDRLMLEFCPEQMTDAQRERWALHQRPTPPSNCCQHVIADNDEDPAMLFEDWHNVEVGKEYANNPHYQCPHEKWEKRAYAAGFAAGKASSACGGPGLCGGDTKA